MKHEKVLSMKIIILACVFQKCSAIDKEEHFCNTEAETIACIERIASRDNCSWSQPVSAFQISNVLFKFPPLLAIPLLKRDEHGSRKGKKWKVIELLGYFIMIINLNIILTLDIDRKGLTQRSFRTQKFPEKLSASLRILCFKMSNLSVLKCRTLGLLWTLVIMDCCLLSVSFCRKLFF